MSYDDPQVGTIVAFILGTLVLIAALSFGIHACYTAQNATLGTVDQDVDRHNFEHSEAYRQGLRRDFDELMLAYSRAQSDDERGAILSVLRHRVADAPPEAVPQDVKDFLATHK